MKKLLPYLGALLIGVILGAILFRPSGPDPAYWIARADYDRDVATVDAKLKDALAMVTQAGEIIAEKDDEIAALLESAGEPSPGELAKDREIAELELKVEGFEAQGDLASALAASKAENIAWAEKFSLAAGMHRESLTALNKAWQVKFDAQVVISREGWAAHDREHALRVNCDELRLGLEKSARSQKLWKPIAIAEAVVITAISIFGK